MPANEEKTIYELFRFSLIVKAIGSVGEMLAGLAIFLIPDAVVLHAAVLLSQGDTGGDADDFLAHTAVQALHSLMVSNNLIIGSYLFVRGLIQLILTGALFRNKIWAYPLLLLVLAILVCTQVYDIYLSHSIATSAITLIDIATIYLVWHEYRIVQRIKSAALKTVE